MQTLRLWKITAVAALCCGSLAFLAYRTGSNDLNSGDMPPLELRLSAVTQPPSERPTGSTQLGDGHTSTPVPATPSAIQRQLSDTDSKKLDRYFDAVHRGRELRQQIAKLGELDPVQRQVVAGNLRRDIEQWHKQQWLSTAEALFLKLAIARAHLDQPDYKDYAEQLLHQHRQKSEQKMHLHRSQRDPQFDDYKRREALIAAEILAMEHLPAGLSREQLLKQRLNDLRSKLYPRED